MKQIVDGKALQAICKEFADKEIQTQPTIFMDSGNVSKKTSTKINQMPTEGDATEELVQDANQFDEEKNLILSLLKEHAIDILTRMNPKKKGYYKLVWEDMDLNKLLNYQMGNVFGDKMHEEIDEIGEGVTFKGYLL